MKTAPRLAYCLSCGDVPWSLDQKCPRCRSRLLGAFKPDRPVPFMNLLPINTARVLGDIAQEREVSPSVLELLTKAARRHIEDQHAADELLAGEISVVEESAAEPVVEPVFVPAPLTGPLFSRHGARHSRKMI